MPTEIDLAKRAHAMLGRVMEQDASARRAFVHEQCADDPALLRRLLDTLDAADGSGAFLDTPALGRAPDAASNIPDAVGNYLVVGVLGAGGMATVYEAIQERPRRRVALKVLHKSMTHTDAYLRFRFETETLARLHHPGIAQIYEAGAARLDQSAPAPFFAMELIPNAAPITTYADRHALSLHERVAMFISVCDAVHHGHQHGVIHRDLKPGNVLVDGEGRAKVIDFGVARTTDSKADSITTVSDFRQLIGTLNYMSPEQCGASDDIDIRTDVYSLGVMLYELACGRLPHDFTDTPIPAALHAIMHEPARRPVIGSPKSNRDLEAIILKAIDKDPDRRYQSALALASDLRRSLDHQPIEARPPGVIDQVALFTRRNRALVAAMVTIVVCIALVATISTVMALRLSREVAARRAAETRSIHERDAALWQAYTAQIAGALSAMKTGEFQQMRTRLAASTHPRRGWEWGFLTRLAERSVSTVVAHNDMIRDLAVNHDWTRFATAAEDGSIRLWNAADTTLIGAYESDTGAYACSPCFSPDGRWLVAGDGGGSVRVFDASDLRLVNEIACLPTAVRRVVVLSDGRVFAADAGGAAVILSLDTGYVAMFPPDQPGGVHGFEASPDGALIATYNDRGLIWVRRSDDLSVVRRYEFPDVINQVRFSADGRLLGACGASTNVFVWNNDDGSFHRAFRVTGGVNTVLSLAFSRDASMVAAGLIHRGIQVVSLADGSVVGELGGHTEAVAGLWFCPDDQLLVSASRDRTIRAWRTSEFGAPAGTITLTGHRDRVYGIAYAPDGSAIASSSRDGDILLWDPYLARPFARIAKSEASMYDVAYSSDGRLIAGAYDDGVIRVFDAANGVEVAELTGNEAWVAAVAFDPTGERVVSGGHDNTVRVWDVRTREQTLVLRGHAERVNGVGFSPDGSVIASASRDGSVRLWDATTGAPLFTLWGHESDVFAVLFSHDGRYVYSGSRDQSVRVWDVRTGDIVRALDGHGQFVTCLALNTDATRLAAGSWFGEIILFDVDTFDLIASFRAHESAIRGVAFSPDGRWLASGSFDGTVRLFDSATREEADAARERAESALHDATLTLLPYFDGGAMGPVDLLGRLDAAGLNVRTDPWLRKAAISTVAPFGGRP